MIFEFNKSVGIEFKNTLYMYPHPHTYIHMCVYIFCKIAQFLAAFIFGEIRKFDRLMSGDKRKTRSDQTDSLAWFGRDKMSQQGSQKIARSTKQSITETVVHWFWNVLYHYVFLGNEATFKDNNFRIFVNCNWCYREGDFPMNPQVRRLVGLSVVQWVVWLVRLSCYHDFLKRPGSYTSMLLY